MGPAQETLEEKLKSSQQEEHAGEWIPGCRRKVARSCCGGVAEAASAMACEEHSQESPRAEREGLLQHLLPAQSHPFTWCSSLHLGRRHDPGVGEEMARQKLKRTEVKGGPLFSLEASGLKQEKGRSI